jgi:hypothetical protein
MTKVVISVCHSEDDARRAIVEIAAQLDIDEGTVSVVRCESVSYDRTRGQPNPVNVRDLALDVFVVVGRKD